MHSVVIITPTIGSPHLMQCVDSVKNQTYPNIRHQIVIDGHEYCNKVSNHGNNSVVLSRNVGANNWYGHRVYAAFTYLVNEDYVIYLDEDNWLEPNHVESLINTITKNNIHWAYAFRNIVSKDGEFICKDNCESLGWWPSVSGYNHIDTSSFCVKLDVAIACAGSWFNKWGADRQFYNALQKHTNKYAPSKEYSLNYRLDGNPGSPKKEFFINGNIAMRNFYSAYDKLPWEQE